MKSAIFAGLLGLATFASAAPADIVRRQSSAAPSSSYAVSSGVAAATGAYSTGGLYASGTGAPYPMSTGSMCSPNGALICNGPDEFGVCNFGKVVFQPVAAGTQCKDGTIVFAESYES